MNFPFLSLRRSYVRELTKDELERWVDPDPLGIKLNPVEYLVTDLVEKILSYLSVVDLLDASLVSHEWYELIANSVLCMKKVQLNLDRVVPSDFDVSRNSLRKYQVAMVTHNKSKMFTEIVDFLITSQKRWKCIDMSHTIFDSRAQYLSFLNAIAPTVEKLMMVRVSVKNCDDESPCDVQFPCLKKLEVKNCHALMNKSFGNARNLKYLHINHASDRSAGEVIRKMLRNSPVLKNLSIGGNIFCEIFEELADDIPFKLTLLSAHCFENPPEYSNVKRNFNKFLTVHRSSLKCIYIDADLGPTIQENIFFIMNVDCVTLLD